MIEINAVNDSGLTAFDLLLIFPSQAGDREIAEILHAKGARRARELTLSTESSETSFRSRNEESPISPSQLEANQMEPNNLLDYFSFKRGRDTPSEARSSLLMISILAATATFQAGISPPGGFWQDFIAKNKQNMTRTNSNKDYYVPGTAIWGDTNMVAYILFILYNSVGFYTSLLIIKMLTIKFPLQPELQVCMAALILSYNVAMIDSSPPPVKTVPVTATAVLSPIIPSLIWARHPSSIQFMKHVTGLIKQFLCP